MCVNYFLDIKSLKNRNSDVQMNVPFLGRSSYDTQFPQWSTMANNKTKYEKHIMNNEIPFSGKSSYMSTYGNFEDKYYKEKTNPILKKDNLEYFKLKHKEKHQLLIDKGFIEN